MHFFLAAWILIVSTSGADVGGLVGDALITVVFLGAAAFFSIRVLFRDFFTHTYYPIRFNRRTRQVYVFRDKRDGGILMMPWEQGFFHVGEGLRDKRLLDLRCHLLDGDIVKDTFVTGMFYAEAEHVRQLWEFVRRYMDESIESVGKDTEVWVSPVPTWMNCRIMVGVNLGGLSGVRAILWPLALPVICTRWLVLRTCKAPVWPQEIEDACRVEPDDPHRLPEPEHVGQFVEQWQAAHPHWNDGNDAAK